jgi:hypothetical protein
MSLAPLDRIAEIAKTLRAAGAVLSGEGALHVYLARATGSRPGESARYSALPPRRIEAIWADATGGELPGVHADRSEVAGVVRNEISLFSADVTLADGTVVPTLSREAVLAQLLEQGGLSIGLAGTLIQVAGDPPIDVDEVRELLKAARQNERFQPLLELVQIAS